jgi:predicted PurR-regulated permease PerM
MLYRGGMDDSDRTPEKSPKAASVEEAYGYPPSPNWAPNTKLMVISMGFVLSIVGIYLIRNVIAVAALAALIAFLVAPLIRLSVRHLRMPRGVALLIAYLVVFLGTIGFGYLMTKSIVACIIE